MSTPLRLGGLGLADPVTLRAPEVALPEGSCPVDILIEPFARGFSLAVDVSVVHALMPSRSLRGPAEAGAAASRWEDKQTQYT